MAESKPASKGGASPVAPPAKPVSPSKPNVTHVVQFASTIAAAHAATKGIDKLTASSLNTIVETAIALEALVRLHASSPSSS